MFVFRSVVVYGAATTCYMHIDRKAHHQPATPVSVVLHCKERQNMLYRDKICVYGVKVMVDEIDDE